MSALTKLFAFAALALSTALASAADQPLAVVAAENFYGDLVQQVGGPHVQVTSIMNNPDQDPHLFEASVSTARALSAARLVIYNGMDYDPWMTKLLTAARAQGRAEIVVGRLLGKRSGDNPHLWYDPATMPTVARAIAARLQAVDPAHSADYRRNLDQVLASLAVIGQHVQSLRVRYAGTAVTATEPVFGLMAQALGLTMRNERFQLAVMNNTEPSASDIAAFERDLKSRQVRVLFYNNQASDPSAKRMRTLAQQSGVKVVGISETMPAGRHYQDWMRSQLDQLEKALNH
ncbi:metal ABC transporter solute-binding protein, Zn/Mn family [Paludibacterium purpuratum]|uniref:Zinc/manganese transport system substrate-binding protein n=1 Tax=Paludibacterium purpuratum TaxID=1144873 RepID=A0A4R7BEX4_9NEIS|nr:zinc ABC transporter substrate-binding protein [Paludibacterium purpuratum]TDR82237.1 zinc/manganese transport system substrate-binding protein [Paludibacterium purpuratum]